MKSALPVENLYRRPTTDEMAVAACAGVRIRQSFRVRKIKAR